jgi:hypothetical protein
MSAEEVQRVLEAVVAAASPSASDEVRRLAAQYSEQVTPFRDSRRNSSAAIFHSIEWAV